MEFKGISPTAGSQCPSHSEMVRRNVKVRLVESRNSKAELPPSGPEVSLQLCSWCSRDSRHCMARTCHGEEEDEDGVRPCTCAVYFRVEDLQCAKDEARNVAAKTAKTKPKAGALVVCGQSSDDDKADSLRDRYLVPIRRVTGTVTLADPRGTTPHRATASVCSDLCKQLDDMNLQTERERNKNTRDERHKTIPSCIWGLPGSRAPECCLGTARRTRYLHAAGILPQEQIRVKGFSGTPFRLL